MYEMITGRVPFDSDTPVSVALKHMQEDPVEPIILKTDIPASVNDIIMKAMKKDPEKRYSTATEMLKDLEMSIKNPTGGFVSKEDNKNFETQRISLNYDREINNKNNSKKGKFAKIGGFFEKHPVLKIFAMIFTGILIFTVTMVIAYFTFTLGKEKEVQVPNLYNLTIEEARAITDELNIEIKELEGEHHPEIQEGQIIRQTPTYQENYKIKEGSTIEVVKSLGIEMVKIPEDEEKIGDGKDFKVVKAALEEVKLVVEIKRENSDKIEKDMVIKKEYEKEVDGSKEVKKGQEIPAGTKVIVYVSDGPEQVEVPDLSGKTESEAKTAITNAKLKWKSTDKISDSSKPNGVIVNQSISSGSMVDKDTEITITINEFTEIKDGSIVVNVAAILNYTTKTDAEGNEIAPESVQIILSLDGEEYATKNVSENNTNCKFSISSTGSKTAKIQIKSSTGSTLTTKTFTYNSGENKSI